MFPDNIISKICQMVEYFHMRHLHFWQLLDKINEKLEREVEPHYPNMPTDISVQPWVVDYMNRKHIFAYNGTGSSITLTSDDNNAWKTVLPANTWTNISYAPGTRLQATALNSVIRVKCTDELIP